MEPTRALLAAAHAVLAAIAGMLGLPHPGSPPPGLPGDWYASAPYYQVLSAGEPAPRTVMKATGQNAFILAFILARGRQCAPAWKGTDPVSGDRKVAAVIGDIRKAGGDVAVSAGGAAGTKLGQACPTAAATAAAYQRVIRAYRLHAFDLDLEDTEIARPGAIARELGAARILKAADPGLSISVTMPGVQAGTDSAGLHLLTEARTLRFVPFTFTLMPFDHRFAGGAAQVAALRNFHAQLERTFGWTSGQAYEREGFSGTNGRGGPGEIFRPADFRTVLAFARRAGLGRFTFWSVNRDRPCAKGKPPLPCSGVSQRPWEFTRITAGA
jgi:chitinase